MYACIFGRSVSKTSPATNEEPQTVLADLAFTFSPLVEQTTADAVVLDIAGQDLMFGSPSVAWKKPSTPRSIRRTTWQ